LTDIFDIASKRAVDLISITDHDAIECQGRAKALAESHGIHYITGVELNITFSHPGYREGKPISLDLLGYGYHMDDKALLNKIQELRAHREKRAVRILENLNKELMKEGLRPFDEKDLRAIEQSADGALGRPHIARYMVQKGIVSDVQEAFDRYLVKCDVPKLPLSLEEASELIRNAGGKAVLAHGNDPNGTSLRVLTRDIREQLTIIKERMLNFLDGLECWHARHDKDTIKAYLSFARKHGLLVTGGSDCHQNPVRIGTLDIPAYVAEQFQL